MVSGDVILYILIAVTLLGSVVGAFFAIHLMDCLSGPAERRRAMELAARKDARHSIRLRIVEKLFPANKKYRPKEQVEGDEEATPEELALCAICIEPFKVDEEVMEGIQCHHEYHYSCMMEWLKQHNDCPVCRKRMWTQEAFTKAKQEVILQHPGISEIELAAINAEESASVETGLSTQNTADEGDYAAGEPVEGGDGSADVVDNAVTQELAA